MFSPLVCVCVFYSKGIYYCIISKHKNGVAFSNKVKGHKRDDTPFRVHKLL